MASHEAAIIQYLLATLTVNPTPEGISPPPLPPGKGVSGTYIVVEEIAGQELQSLGGPSDYSNSIMQFKCYNTLRETAHDMRARIKAALVNKSGSVGSLHIDGSEQSIDHGMYDAERNLQVSITRIRMSFTTP